MYRLIRRGSKTKLDTEWNGQEAITRLNALKNGADLGKFPSAAEAKAHAETLLSGDRAGMYCVLAEDGSIASWIYDSREQRRLDRRRDWCSALLTACILAFITAASESLLGIPPSSTMGGALIAGSAGLYLVMRTSQNSIESLVAWFFMFVLVMTMLSLWLHKNERRKQGKSWNGTDQTQVDHRSMRADGLASWPPPPPTARIRSPFSATLKTWPSA
ncbi:MAG: hypothetical protein ACYC67_07490 [Prosthecobacter sp.]